MPASSVGKPEGLVLLGGTHSSIAFARSVAAAGVPVWLFSDDGSLPRFSRAFTRTVEWAGANGPDAVHFLIEAAEKFHLRGYLLVACGDAEVHLVSQHHEHLATVFSLFLSPWDRLRWACEKTLAYRRAEEIGLSYPRMYRAASADDAAALALRFPIVLKPSTRVDRNPFTQAKAWQIDGQEEFAAAYRRAADFVGAENVVIQELVAGGGESQFSYAALWNEGRPVAEFTARRTRQFPVDFGFTSTFVEVLDRPDAMEAGRKFAQSIQHHGLIEVEFKRDPENGELKLLDVNPRPWSWFALADASGVPLGRMMWAIARGEAMPQADGPRAGIRWMFLPRDVVAAAVMMMRRMLSPGAYLASFRNVRAWALFKASDPLPALIDVPLTAARVITRRLLPRLRSGTD